VQLEECLYRLPNFRHYPAAVQTAWRLAISALPAIGLNSVHNSQPEIGSDSLQLHPRDGVRLPGKRGDQRVFANRMIKRGIPRECRRCCVMVSSGNKSGL